MTSPVVRPTATICRPASFVWFLTVVFLCFALCAPVATAGDGAAAGGKNAAEAAQGEKARPAQPSPGEKFVAEATVKLENFTFGAADLAAAARYAKQAKTPAQRLPFALLAARYHREYENRPDRAAAEVLPHLFNKNVVADWEKATARLRQGAKPVKPATTGKQGADGDDGDAGADAAAPATAALAPLAPLPPAGEWKLTADNAAAAVEVAGCLAAAGQMQEALAIIERVGADFTGGNRVAAAETAGDLNFRNAAYSRAVEFYDFAIGYLDHAMGTEKPDSRSDEGAYAREFSEYENALRARLARKRGDAQRQLEAEQYGSDWVAYRDATREDWERHDPASAYLEYQKIVKEWPDTVYAEAARCYAIKCLLALATG
ncbi:MAG: hypothetical protein J6333_12885, partial [Planctomycetes bacterium]|nr:hypothetical protein [Planctomycetota bacterium]